MKIRYFFGALALCASIKSQAGTFDSILCYNKNYDIFAINYAERIHIFERFGIPIKLIRELEEFFRQSQSFYQKRRSENMWLELPNTFLTTGTSPLPYGEVIKMMSLASEITYGVECEFDMSLDNQFFINYKPPTPPNPSTKKSVVFIHTDLLGTPVAETDQNGDVL